MRVSLFVPCLVDRFLPEIGIASVKLLEAAGVEVHVDSHQTCCGQPPYNAGFADEATHMARRMLAIFGDADVVVSPSGSCVAMVRDAYGDLDLPENDLLRWRHLRERVFDLSEFLVRNDLHKRIKASMPLKGGSKLRAVVHHTCHHLRHVHGASALGTLLGVMDGLEVVESPRAHTCCGFGGVFSMKLPELSIAMGRKSLTSAEAERPDLIVLADAGCILHLRGIAAAQGDRAPASIVHYSQLLSGTGLPVLRKS